VHEGYAERVNLERVRLDGITQRDVLCDAFIIALAPKIRNTAARRPLRYSRSSDASVKVGGEGKPPGWASSACLIVRPERVACPAAGVIGCAVFC